jgi:hypothetical protein
MKGRKANLAKELGHNATSRTRGDVVLQDQ